MEVQLEEIFVAPFTTPTTCFSCTPCADSNRNLPFRLVTENHILGLAALNGSYRGVTYSAVPRDKPSVICVGLAQYATPEPCQALQALTFIDPTCIDQPEDVPPPLHHPSSNVVPETTIRDDASVVSNTLSIQDGSIAPNSRSHSRRPSFNSTAAMTAATGSSSSALSRTNSDTSILRVSDASLRISTIEDGPIAILPISLQPPKARLILQGPSALVQDSIAVLDFRPLSPCIAQWGSVCGVFVGSADDSQLRFYEPKQGRLIPRSDLPEEYFRMDTPVMGIDFHSNGETHTLALAGQDGTIQLITWKGDDRAFQDISAHSVIVDGPLISLRIQERDGGELQIVVGSLCGYVCQLKRPSSSLEWQGPTMVVQGLWNKLLQDEDSVLAVHAFGDYVALGTLGGRCLIYRATLFGEKYDKAWECTLPYSIHGLDVRSSTEDSFDLIVVTRRSLHVFRPKFAVPTKLDRTTYSVTNAKNRLQSLLRPPEPQQPLSPDNNPAQEYEEEEEEFQTIPDQSPKTCDAKDEEEQMIEENTTGNLLAVTSSIGPVLEALIISEIEPSDDQICDEDANALDNPKEILQIPETSSTELVHEQTVSENDKAVGETKSDSEKPGDKDSDDSQWVMIDAVQDTMETEEKVAEFQKEIVEE